MDHGTIDVSTARGLEILRERIAKKPIPSSKLDESLNIATWNIREFGRKRRLNASIHFIAEILNQFDIISIVELRDDLTDLKRVMEILGPYWKVVFSDFIQDRGGNWERIGYLYDYRAVTFTGLASGATGPRKKDKKTKEYLPEITWWRNPFMASFRAGSFDFILLSAHIRWGSSQKERLKPLTMLADWVYKRRKSKFVFDKDFIVLGDFNIPKKGDELYEAVTARGLQMPKALFGVHGSNLVKDKRYDQILHSPLHDSLFSDKGGVLDFFDTGFKLLFPGVSKTKDQFTYELSDHLPLWMQLNIDTDKIKLDQMLNPK